jgi:hypothetical protein
MADEVPPQDIDIDEATLAIMRGNHETMLELQARVEAAEGEDERRLISEFLACLRRQEAVVSEVPGLESYAHSLGKLRQRAEKEYGLQDAGL